MNKQSISNLYYYDKDFLMDLRIPEENRFLINSKHDLPILIIENAMNLTDCIDIFVDAKKTSGERHSRLLGGKVMLDHRTTFDLHIGKKSHQLYHTCINNHRLQINDYFGVTLTSTQGPSIYGYNPGGHYTLHCDNSQIGNFTKPLDFYWRLDMPFRKISTILFLGDCVEDSPDKAYEFSEGEVEFSYIKQKSNNTPLLIKPKMGTLIAFPSNPYFSHIVKPVKAGYRISIVEWYNADY